MCNCNELPDYVKADAGDTVFKKFVTVDWKRDAWVKLIRCPSCGQHWQIDEWDRYQTGLALKIEEPENWKTFDDTSQRIHFLIQSREGFSENECAWQGCSNKALKGLAYCPSCAYRNIGIRE